jgi:hypothetical protein
MEPIKKPVPVKKSKSKSKKLRQVEPWSWSSRAEHDAFFASHDPAKELVLFTEDGVPHKIPRVLHSLEQVPEPIREELLESRELLRHRLTPDPNPWKDLDPQLWGSDAAFDSMMYVRCRFRAKEAKACSDPALAAIWSAVRAEIEAGRRNPTHLLEVALSLRVTAAQLIRIQQLINMVLPCWAREDLPAGSDDVLPWQINLVPDAAEEAPAYWGSLRSALARGNLKAAEEVLEAVAVWAHPRQTPGHYLPAWTSLQQELRAYYYAARPLKQDAPDQEQEPSDDV